MLHSICQQICKAQPWPQDWKRSVLNPVPKKGSTKECSHHRTVALISHADAQAGFRKGRGTRGQSANIHWIIEKAREFQINMYFCFIEMLKPVTVWTSRNCGKFSKRWEYQTTLLASCETCMEAKKQQLEQDMGQQTDSKSGKEYIKAVYYHPAYLT